MAGTRWARLDYPSTFQMTPEDMAGHCGWRMKRRGPDIEICLAESYERRAFSGLEVIAIADGRTHTDPARYAAFDRLRPQDEYMGGGRVPERVLSLPEVTNPSDPQDPWVALRLLYLTTPDRDLARFVQKQFEGVLDADPDARLFVVQVAPELQWRIAAARSLFAAQFAPKDWVPDADRVSLFPSSSALMRSQLQGLSQYVSAPGLSLAPWISIFVAPRLGGSLAIVLGRPLPGLTAKQAPELLDVFRPTGYTGLVRSGPAPILDARQGEATLRWWVQRINALFSVALDPGRFTTADGTYDLARQLGVLLSLERLFDAVVGVLTHAPRDPYVRLLLMFDTLDLLEGLTYEGWEQMVTASKVVAGLHQLEGLLPGDVASMLLPRCRAASDALGSLADGFLPSFVIDGSMVAGRAKDGRDERHSRERAAAFLLRALRNSGHSFTEQLRDPRDISVLVAHGGDLPEAVSDLAWLHLLRFVAAPRLRSLDPKQQQTP